MKIAINQASDILTAYIVERMIPEASLAGKAKLGFLLPVLPTWLAAQAAMAAAIGLVDVDGNVDLEAFERCSRSAMEAAGKISMVGFTFGKQDMDGFFGFVAERVKGMAAQRP